MIEATKSRSKALEIRGNLLKVDMVSKRPTFTDDMLIPLLEPDCNFIPDLN